MKNLTEQIKKIKINEAIRIANNLEGFQGSEDELLAAYIKLAATATAINSAAELLSNKITKEFKAVGKEEEITAQLSVIQPDGTTKESNLFSKFFEEITSKEEVDFKQYAEDNNIEVVTTTSKNTKNNNILNDIRKQYSNVVGIIVGDESKMGVFKNPTLYGNDTAFKTAASNDASLSKYKKLKTSKKYKTSLTIEAIKE